jgi:Chloramphenicol O-acetyltransferase
MKKINIDSWSRKEMADFYKDFNDPCFSVVSPIDITKLYQFTQMHRISFYYSLIYLSISALESIDEFHYKINKDEVFYYDHLVPSFTDLRKGETKYYIVTTKIQEDISLVDFAKQTKIVSASQTKFIDDSNFDPQELVYITCLPWMDITSVTEERKFNVDDSIPHLCWGKYVQTNGKYVLHYEVLVNHRLVDGYHVGLFFNRLQELINNL